MRHCKYILLMAALMAATPAIAGQPLNSDYRISGDGAAALRQVFDDGKRTYLEAAAAHSPALPRRLYAWRGRFRVALEVVWQSPYWVIDQVADRFTMSVGGRALTVENRTALPTDAATGVGAATGAIGGGAAVRTPAPAPPSSATTAAPTTNPPSRLAHCAPSAQAGAATTVRERRRPLRDPRRPYLWELRAGDTLRRNLARWAAQAGWCFRWELAWNYEIPAGTTLRGTFSGADGVVALLIGKYRKAPVPLQAHFAHGNKTLVIVAARYRRGDDQ